MPRTIEDIFTGRKHPIRREELPLDDHEAWQIYQALVGYGVPHSEAQAVVDALAKRSTPSTGLDLGHLMGRLSA